MENLINSNKKYDVYGFENPLIDVLSQVDESVIEKLSMDKGIMQLIDSNRRNEIIDALNKNYKLSPGGSGANTIISLADFGLNVSYSGGIGNDEFGNEFEAGLRKLGVNSLLKRKTLQTGSSIILITPDAQRTMNTFLGACQQFSKNDIDSEIEVIKNSKILYFTGYMWDTDSQKDAVEYAISIAKQNNVKIFFDVADPFAVARSRADFLELIKTDVDFVFANEEEAKCLMGTETATEAIEELIKIAKAGAVKVGSKGSVVFSDGIKHNIEGFKINAVDTTGAGDMYSAGMIYGLIKGYNLDRSGKIASYVSSRVVEKIGARLDYSLKGKVDDI